MYVWLENIDFKSFEVCVREFLPFEGEHEDTIVVGEALWNVSLLVQALVHVIQSETYKILEKWLHRPMASQFSFYLQHTILDCANCYYVPKYLCMGVCIRRETM